GAVRSGDGYRARGSIPRGAGGGARVLDERGGASRAGGGPGVSPRRAAARGWALTQPLLGRFAPAQARGVPAGLRDRADASGSPRESFYRNVKATAESGLDFSSRWMRDPKDLRSLETTDLIPVDLNSLLYHAERTLAALRAFRGRAGDAEVAGPFARAAGDRRRALP